MAADLLAPRETGSTALSLGQDAGTGEQPASQAVLLHAIRDRDRSVEHEVICLALHAGSLGFELTEYNCWHVILGVQRAQYDYQNILHGTEPHRQSMSCFKTYISVMPFLTVNTAMSTPTLDGSASTGSSSPGGNSGTVTLTTNQTNDIILLGVVLLQNASSVPSVTSVSDSLGLTWRKRASSGLLV